LTKWASFNTDLAPHVTRGTTVVIDNSKLQVQSLDDLGDALREPGEAALASASSVEAAALRKQAVLQKIGDVATAYRGASDMLLGIADEYGLLDDKLRAIGESIGGIATAVSLFASGDGIGGTIAGLSAIATVLKGVLGPSPEATRAREILERNSRVIEENTKSILRNTPGATFAGIGQLLGGLFGEGGTGLGALTVGAGRPRVDEGRIRGFLVGELTKMGLSFSEFEQLAKDVGITLDLSTIDRANDTLRHFFERLGQVSVTGVETLEDQLDRIRTGISIGAIKANEEFGQVVGVLRGLEKPPTALLGALDGIDVRTEEGAAGAVRRLRDLFTSLPTLSEASLGGLTRDQFTSLIAQLIGLLESGSTLRSGTVDTGGTTSAGGVELGDSPPSTPKTKGPGGVAAASGSGDPTDLLTSGIDWSVVSEAVTVSSSYLAELVALETQALKELTTLTAAASRPALLPSLALPSLDAFDPREAALVAAQGGLRAIEFSGDVNIALQVTATGDAQAIADTVSDELFTRIDEEFARRSADARILRGDGGR
ncbi:MAG: hypothetical protein ACYC2K_10565, partial [Gemmatimonadales bacterium]